jgi:hypothetical protein
VRPIHLGGPRDGNKHLVEVVAHLELLRSGLTSEASGAVLADPAAAAERVRFLLEERLPRARRGRTSMLLSDPPANPLAYHALSVGMLARACALAPCSRRTLAVLDATRRASWVLTAPDGDLAYTGRSQEQAWALALTAYGAPEVAEPALTRLRERHPVGPEGMAITPAIGINPIGGALGLDPYAGAGVYNGLTLVALGWAVQDGAPPPAPSRLLSDRSGARVLGTGPDRFAVVRRGDLWFAVRQQPAGGAHERDLRLDFGLVALKSWTGTRWRDVAGPPPKTYDAPDSAGPWLVRGGRRARPVGRGLHVRDGAVLVDADFATPDRAVLRRGVRFRFAPSASGVDLSLPVRRGDRLELSAFAPPPCGR